MPFPQIPCVYNFDMHEKLEHINIIQKTSLFEFFYAHKNVALCYWSRNIAGSQRTTGLASLETKATIPPAISRQTTAMRTLACYIQRRKIHQHHTINSSKSIIYHKNLQDKKNSPMKARGKKGKDFSPDEKFQLYGIKISNLLSPADIAIWREHRQFQGHKWWQSNIQRQSAMQPQNQCCYESWSLNQSLQQCPSYQYQ